MLVLVRTVPVDIKECSLFPRQLGEVGVEHGEMELCYVLVHLLREQVHVRFIPGVYGIKRVLIRY